MAVRVRLDRQIRIEQQTTTTNASNEKVVTGWGAVVTIWAERKDETAKVDESYEGNRLSSSSYTMWTIPYPPTQYMPTTKMRLVEVATGDVYDIEGMMEPNGTVKEYLTLRCKQTQQR